MAQKPEGLSTEEEQKKLLAEAKNVVLVQGFHMKRCLDNSKLMDALKHASNMISELRTSLLSPKNYYALYIECSDQLRHLESFLSDEKQSKRMSELYELVQYAGNILPRLYLLITVGSVYIKSKEAPAKEVLKDLVEMCRGVQHPTRGLFLRNYLSEATKDKLPDSGSLYEGGGGTVKDSIDFILQNFTEMNKLWVRMQHQGQVREKDKREQERQELKILVGKNLSRLSQLDGVDNETYTKTVLPKIIEQIINCKDQIAQQYLMECAILVFPDEFHLNTLETVLETCTQLTAGVDVKAIMVSLIDRLANYASRYPESVPKDIEIFNIFSKYIGRLIEERSEMQIEAILALQASLLGLSLSCYPDRLDYVDNVLLLSNNALAKCTDVHKPSCSKLVVRLLSVPLDNYKNILTVLKLQNFAQLLSYLNFNNRKQLAKDIVRNVLENNTYVGEPEQVNKLLELISPLVKDQSDRPEGEVDQEDFEEEQHLVASLVHMFQSEEVEQQFALYLTARKHFVQGEARMKHTLVPLVFGSLRLVLKLKEAGERGEDEEWSRKGRKVFQFVHETVMQLAKANLPDLALRLFLQSAQSAATCGFETIAYEFMTQALLLYENEISEQKAQYNALTLAIGALQTMRCFSEENYDTLSTTTTKYASKLLAKPDQCRAIYMCSHLFWTGEEHGGVRDGRRVLECLQKSLRIADTCMDSSMNVHLFVEILNEYLYYFENKNEHVTVKYINGLIALINTNIANMEQNAENGAITTHYQNTLKHIAIKKMQQETPYAAIEIN